MVAYFCFWTVGTQVGAAQQLFLEACSQVADLHLEKQINPYTITETLIGQQDNNSFLLNFIRSTQLFQYLYRALTKHVIKTYQLTDKCYQVDVQDINVIDFSSNEFSTAGILFVVTFKEARAIFKKIGKVSGCVI